MALHRLLILSVLISLLSTIGCSPADEATRADPEDVPGLDQAGEALENVDDPDPEDIVSGVGTIIYVDLEGGFYGLVAEDGTKYNPLNLEDAFKQDSLRVRFRGVLRTDVMTTRMWGRNLEIQEMLRVNTDDG